MARVLECDPHLTLVAAACVSVCDVEVVGHFPHEVDTEAPAGESVRTVEYGPPSRRTGCVLADGRGILVRDLGPESATTQMDTVLARANRFCGVHHPGDEVGHAADLFAGVFARARDAGLHVTVHAGEAAGPGSVWKAPAPHPDRIGPGVAPSRTPTSCAGTAPDSDLTVRVGNVPCRQPAAGAGTVG